MLDGLLGVSRTLINGLESTGGPLYPFPLWMGAHAARVSLIFRSKVRSNSTQGRLTWRADLAGFLVFAWAGAICNTFLLGNTLPQLLSPNPWIAYTSVHLAISFVLSWTPLSINNPLLDFLLFWLDAASRAGAILGAIHDCSHSPNELIRQSAWAPLLLGSLAPVAGGTFASMFHLHEQAWGFSSPFWLQPGSSLLNTLEMWTGAMAVVFYCCVTPSSSSPAFAPWKSAMGLPAQGSMSSEDAQAAVVAALTFAYGLKAALNYSHHPARSQPMPTPVTPKKRRNQQHRPSPAVSRGH